jgi:hypothetical protein
MAVRPPSRDGPFLAPLRCNSLWTPDYLRIPHVTGPWPHFCVRIRTHPSASCRETSASSDQIRPGCIGTSGSFTSRSSSLSLRLYSAMDMLTSSTTRNDLADSAELHGKPPCLALSTVASEAKQARPAQERARPGLECPRAKPQPAQGSVGRSALLDHVLRLTQQKGPSLARRPARHVHPAAADRGDRRLADAVCDPGQMPSFSAMVRDMHADGQAPGRPGRAGPLPASVCGHYPICSHAQ